MVNLTDLSPRGSISAQEVRKKIEIKKTDFIYLPGWFQSHLARAWTEKVQFCCLQLVEEFMAKVHVV
jgi:hypothetical protein